MHISCTMPTRLSPRTRARLLGALFTLGVTGCFVVAGLSYALVLLLVQAW